MRRDGRLLFRTGKASPPVSANLPVSFALRKQRNKGLEENILVVDKTLSRLTTLPYKKKHCIIVKTMSEGGKKSVAEGISALAQAGALFAGEVAGYDVIIKDPPPRSASS